MGFNFGAFAGGLGKGAQEGAQIAQEYNQYANQKNFQDAMQNAPTADVGTTTTATPDGSGSTKGYDFTQPGGPSAANAAIQGAQQGGTQATPGAMVGPGGNVAAAVQQAIPVPGQNAVSYAGQTTAQDAAEYGQKMAMKYAQNPQQFAQMQSEFANAGETNARAQGQGLTNQQTSSALDAVQQLQQGHQTLQAQVAGGDVAGGAKTLMSQLDAAGVQYTLKGSILTEPNGQTFDLSDPHQIMSAGGAYMSGAVGQALQQNAPIAGAQAREQGAMTDYYGARGANTTAQAGQNNVALSIQTDMQAKAQSNPAYVGSPEYMQDLRRLSLAGQGAARQASQQVVGAGKNDTAIRVGAGHDAARVTVGAGNNATAITTTNTRADQSDTNNVRTNDTRVKTTNAAITGRQGVAETNAGARRDASSTAAGSRVAVANINNGKPAGAIPMPNGQPATGVKPPLPPAMAANITAMDKQYKVGQVVTNPAGKSAKYLGGGTWGPVSQ